MRKNILITGASSGIGAGMAREFAARGHNLALCARRTERLLELQAELEAAHGVRVSVQVLDVNDHASVFEVFEAFAAEFDPQPFHLDEDAARDTLFGGLAASGPPAGLAFHSSEAHGVGYLQRIDMAALQRIAARSRPGEPLRRQPDHRAPSLARS